MAVDARLAEAFRIALELPPDLDVETLAYGEHPHWDTVGHMALVAEIEDTFGVTLETHDVLELSSYAKAVELLNRLEDAA
jgi:acyl carrier protein